MSVNTLHKGDGDDNNNNTNRKIVFRFGLSPMNLVVALYFTRTASVDALSTAVIFAVDATYFT